MNPEVKERFDNYIQQRGMRRTAQRDVIVEAAFANDDHFTAEELLDKARRIDPKTSRATVYRTISLLVECHLLKEIDLGRDERVYDPNFLDSPDHNHLICVDCGKIIEFEDENTADGVCDNLIAMRLGKQR